MGRVSGKVALISGGASGLGLASATRLAQEGATVIIADINRAAGEAAAAGIGGARFETLDVTVEREWAALATVTLNTQAVRHAYEAEIAVATVSEGGEGRLEIPAYVEAGAALRTEFYGELLKALGEVAASEVVTKLSERLESRFAGFGAAVQTLDISLREGCVTRTVAYWDEPDLGGETRTRRETIFPQMEDPDGLQWGPLLARVEAAQGQGKKSSRG